MSSSLGTVRPRPSNSVVPISASSNLTEAPFPSQASSRDMHHTVPMGDGASLPGHDMMQGGNSYVPGRAPSPSPSGIGSSASRRIQTSVPSNTCVPSPVVGIQIRTPLSVNRSHLTRSLGVEPDATAAVQVDSCGPLDDSPDSTDLGYLNLVLDHVVIGPALRMLCRLDDITTKEIVVKALMGAHFDLECIPETKTFGPSWPISRVPAILPNSFQPSHASTSLDILKLLQAALENNVKSFGAKDIGISSSKQRFHFWNPLTGVNANIPNEVQEKTIRCAIEQLRDHSQISPQSAGIESLALSYCFDPHGELYHGIRNVVASTGAEAATITKSANPPMAIIAPTSTTFVPAVNDFDSIRLEHVLVGVLIWVIWPPMPENSQYMVSLQGRGYHGAKLLALMLHKLQQPYLGVLRKGDSLSIPAHWHYGVVAVMPTIYVSTPLVLTPSNWMASMFNPVSSHG
ncbi:hypothetical protein DL93DRAFT_2081292 [Clavulina sp. PMI_390]|nr:hypothetical protein DL93DRAFT_2081292 [Clavulina sp. PMI_390]